MLSLLLFGCIMILASCIYSCPWHFVSRVLSCLFHCAVLGPELRKLSKFFKEMLTEEFLVRLVKSRAHGASNIVVTDVMEGVFTQYHASVRGHK